MFVNVEFAGCSGEDVRVFRGPTRTEFQVPYTAVVEVPCGYGYQAYSVMEYFRRAVEAWVAAGYAEECPALVEFGERFPRTSCVALFRSGSRVTAAGFRFRYAVVGTRGVPWVDPSPTPRRWVEMAYECQGVRRFTVGTAGVPVREFEAVATQPRPNRPRAGYVVYVENTAA